MKTLIATLALAASFSASAQMVNVYPHVYNFGNMAQVQINNNTEFNITCDGWVYMQTNMGRMENNYYFDHISKGMMSMRSFRLMNFQEQIRFVHHSINCRKAP